MKPNAILKDFTHFVSLNVLGMIGLSCYILADTFFVAKGLGTNGLTALGLAISGYSFIQGTGLMIGVGGATRYAIWKSQGKHDAANRVFTHSVVLAIAAGFLFAAAGLFLSTPISRLLGADGLILDMTALYLKTVLCFSPFFILNNLMLAFVRNDGNPHLAMAAMLAGSLSNVLLDYILIFPLDMGIFGAALATGLAPILGMAVLSIHIVKRRNGFHLRRVRPDPACALDLCSLGLSSLITELASGLVLIVFNLVILRLSGNIGVAAYSVVANLSLVVISIFTGIAQGLQPLVSSSYGRAQYVELRQLLRYAVLLSVVLAVLLYLVACLFSDGLVAIFNREADPQLAALAKDGLLLYFAGFLFAGFNIVTSAYLSAVAQPRPAFAVCILRGCVAILPAVFALAALWGMNGVWLSFPCAEAIASVAGILALRRSFPGEKQKNAPVSPIRPV